APPGAYHRHVNGGSILVSSSHETIFRASRRSCRISCGGRDRRRNNLSSALTPNTETVRMTTWKPSLSLVYPMFNEEENIERAVHFAATGMVDITSGYEILIVNDDSTDRSGEIAEGLA